MTQASVIQDLLAKRRDRAIAIILGVKDRECDPHLPSAAQAKLRKVVLDQFNDLHDFCLDVMKSLDSGDFNELYLERLDALHRDVEAVLEVVSKDTANAGV